MPFAVPPVGVTVPIGTKKAVQITVGPTPPKHRRLPHRLGTPEICSDSQQAAIKAAFATSASWVNPLIRAMGGACETLADKMLNFGIDDVVIYCDFCDPPGAESSSDPDDSSMSICNFPSQASDLARIVIREQVRLAGGLPIDMWAVDGAIWCRGAGGSTSELDTRALPEMCYGSFKWITSGGHDSGMRAGAYFLWYPVLGDLYSRKKGVVVDIGQTVLGGSIWWKHTC